MRGKPFIGLDYDNDHWIDALKSLEIEERLSGIIIYGCPYLFDKIHEIIPYESYRMCSIYCEGRLSDDASTREHIDEEDRHARRGQCLIGMTLTSPVVCQMRWLLMEGKLPYAGSFDFKMGEVQF